jgi:hypothetical protein
MPTEKEIADSLTLKLKSERKRIADLKYNLFCDLQDYFKILEPMYNYDTETDRVIPDVRIRVTVDRSGWFFTKKARLVIIQNNVRYDDPESLGSLSIETLQDLIVKRRKILGMLKPS